MEVIKSYRKMSTEMKTFLSVANKEVGLSATLELLAHLAGLPSSLSASERSALRQLAIAQNVQIEI